MPATPTAPERTTLPNAEKVRHEEFCTPRPGLSEPRMEAYPYLGDDPQTGRSRPVAQVTRCMECGGAYYDRMEK